MRHSRLFGLIVGLALGFGLRSTPAQDHLEPQAPFPGSEQYWVDMRQVFAEAYAPNVILRVFRLPSLEIEDVVTGIRETNGSYEAFIITSSSRVWDLEEVRQIKAGRKTGIRPDGTLADGSPHSPYVRLVQETPASAAQIKTKMEAASISARLSLNASPKFGKKSYWRPGSPRRNGKALTARLFPSPLLSKAVAPLPRTFGRLRPKVEWAGWSAWWKHSGNLPEKQIGEEQIAKAVKNLEQQ